MYGLSATFDASVFVGKELIEVCFSVNTISFSFERDVLITVMGSFIHRDKQSTSVNKQSVPVSTSSLMNLAGKKVQIAEARQDGTLTLHFENGHSLILLDDSQAYEAYIIRIGDKETIV
jgi:hypothetical protein